MYVLSIFSYINVAECPQNKFILKEKERKKDGKKQKVGNEEKVIDVKT